MDLMKYQCSYCSTLYDWAERCPNCGSSSETAIKINYTQSIQGRKKQLAWDAFFTPIYQFFSAIHLLNSFSWFGLWMAIPMFIVHLVYFLVIRKKIADKGNDKSWTTSKKIKTLFQVLYILDFVLCAISVLIWILIVIYAIFPFEFFGF